MNVPLNVFKEKYLDRLETPLGCVDILKLEVCSFLDQEKRCTIKNFKVIVCDIYPTRFCRKQRCEI